MVKIGVAKCGNIATSSMVDLILDERADRENIDVRVVGTGAKMNPGDIEEVVNKLFEFEPELIIYIGPNPAVPGPAKGRELLSQKGIPSIIIGDGPGKAVKDEMESQGLGYILIEGDPLIGARREFLDPIEMAIFNSYAIKILAITGAFRIVQEEIDKVIDNLGSGKVELPKIIIKSENAVDSAQFQNSYAKVKARAAYEISKLVADIDFLGCFKLKDKEQYIPCVATAHELMRTASILAEEAREIEKSNDTVARKPHSKDGRILEKYELLDKPK